MSFFVVFLCRAIETETPSPTAAPAPQPAAKKPKTTSNAPAPPLPKINISGETMMMGTDQEMLAECRAALAAAGRQCGTTARSLPPPPPQQQSREWWSPSTQAMKVEKGGSEDAAMPVASPAPPAPAAAPVEPPAAPSAPVDPPNAPTAGGGVFKYSFDEFL